MMLKLWKRQFARHRFLMQFHDPQIFFKSQWQKDDRPSLLYILYRWLLTAFLFGTWLLSVIDPKHLDKSIHFRAKWMIYLTNWGYSLCFLQSLLCALTLTIWYCQFKRFGGSVWTSATYRMYWVMNIIATDVAFGITVLYWALLYDETKMEVDAQNIFVHGTNSLVMLIDLFVVAHPLYLVQCYWSVLFGIVYIVFSIIYHLCGGTSRNEEPFIYPVLDWGKPGKTTIVCVLVLVFLIVLHIFSCCIQLFRSHIDKKLRKKSYTAEVTKPPINGFDNVASNDIV
ncbi:protein rolling stone-like isoform X2 [Onthophagus taurus]|nr:protein rolling stone-like isoform X2 [Onthophagus taurus]